MVSKCANPVCAVPFRYLHEGKVFRMDLAGTGEAFRKVEHFWLCGRCSDEMTLMVGENGDITLVPLRQVYLRRSGTSAA